MRRTTPAAKSDDSKFPVRLKFDVPPTGLGAETDRAQDWLLANVGSGRFAVHNAPSLGSDAMAVHLLNVEDAMRFVAAHPNLELGGGEPHQRAERPAGSDDVESAGLFLGAAKGYVISVQDILGLRGDGEVVPQEYVMPIYLLLGFATELVLKAAYLLHGGDHKKLSGRGNTIGHNLRKAHGRALALGFQPVDPEGLTRLVESLQESHQGLWMRYDTAPIGTLRFLLPRICVETISREGQHLSTMAVLLGADA